MRINLEHEALGTGADGRPVFLREIWPTAREIADAVATLDASMFRERYADVFAGDDAWRALPAPAGELYAWEPDSTYIRHPPYFRAVTGAGVPLRGARALAVLGDSITTDHISPAGSISPSSPAAAYLRAQGVAPADFNSYGSRRGNHEVMMRGTFASARLRNELVGDREGGVTRLAPGAEPITIYDAAMHYARAGVPLVVIAGKEYGTGSSRDWAAKGTALLGVRAVIAESFERIHRANLVGMGVLPLEFASGFTRHALALDGSEQFAIEAPQDIQDATPSELVVTRTDGREERYPVRVRIDTAEELEWYRAGGILPRVLFQLAP
jgi:aconitate hydratase